MQSIEVSGDWWQEDNPDRTISGELTFRPQEGVTLDLNGILEEREPPGHAPIRDRSEIHSPGTIIGNLGDGRKALIPDPILTSQSVGHGDQEYTNETFSAHLLFLGPQLEPDQEYKKLALEFPFLPEWLGDSSVRPVLDRDAVAEMIDEDVDVREVHAIVEPEVYRADVDEFTIELSVRDKTTHSIYSVDVDVTGYIDIINEDMAKFGDLFDKADDLIQYLSIAVGKSVFPEQINIYKPEGTRPINVYIPNPDFADQSEIEQTDQLFSVSDLEFEEGLHQLLEHRERYPVFHEQITFLLHNRGIPPRLLFFLSVVALESYHDEKYSNNQILADEVFDDFKDELQEILPDDQDFANQINGLLSNVINEPSIRDKYREVVDQNQEILSQAMDIEETISDAVTYRHKIAHGLSSMNETEIYKLSIKMQAIAETTLIRDIGVNQEGALKMLQMRHQELAYMD